MAHEHDIDIEGACGGECACSTCHVLLEQEGQRWIIFFMRAWGGWPKMIKVVKGQRKAEALS